MSMGFEVFNGEGYKVVGSDFPNLCFYGKGRVNVPTSGIVVPMAQGGEINFYKSSAPLVERNGRLYLCSPAQLEYGRWWSSGDPTSGWIEYFSFGKPSEDSSLGGFGIEVYDESGNLTFNSGRPFLNVVGVKTSSKESYEIAGRATRVYLPFWDELGFSGDLAFSIGNTRIYWTSSQLVNPQTGYFFTDVRRSVRGVHIDAQMRLATARLDTYFQRWSGREGNFNYSPNGGTNLEILIADVSGL